MLCADWVIVSVGHIEDKRRASSKKCPECGKEFAFDSALEMHYRVHSGVRPYSCELCGKSFALKGNLKKHLIVHLKYHEEREFR